MRHNYILTFLAVISHCRVNFCPSDRTAASHGVHGYPGPPRLRLNEKELEDSGRVQLA